MVDLNSEKWDLLDKAHDARALLRLLGFALSADVVLVLADQTNLWELRWSTLADRPAILVAILLSYGAVVKVVAPRVASPLDEILVWIVCWMQRVPGLAPKDAMMDRAYFVSTEDAENWLAQETNSDRRAGVELLFRKQEAAVARSRSQVEASWMATLLVLGTMCIPGSSIQLLGSWHGWAPFVVLSLAAMPYGHLLWYGPPRSCGVYLPSLARELRAKRAGDKLRNARARNNGPFQNARE